MTILLANTQALKTPLNLQTISIALSIFLFGLDDYADETSWTQNYDATLFLERYTKLLKQNGISHYKVCKETKLNESSIRLWKKGKLPKIVSLVEIAKYLNCSIDYLVGRSNEIR